MWTVYKQKQIEDVWNRDRRTISNDVSKGPTKLDPRKIVSFVVIDLVTGEKQDVGVDPLDVFQDVGAGDLPTMAIDAVMEDGRQMLIAGVVDGETLAHGIDGLVATGLRPAV